MGTSSKWRTVIGRIRPAGWLALVGLAVHLVGCGTLISADDFSRVDCVAVCDASVEPPPDSGRGDGAFDGGRDGAFDGGREGAFDGMADGAFDGGRVAFDGTASFDAIGRSDREAVDAALGNLCNVDAECGSGICAQGVCCSSRCNSGCASCALSGREGTCSSVPAGQDPLGDCADMGAASCATDGTCDGAGHCRLYGQGIVCGAAACKDSVATAARTCDGQGACGAGSTTPCTPNICAGAVCSTTCSGVNGCMSGYACNAGQCTSLATGLVGYWKLDEATDGSAAVDSSGQGSTLANVSSTTVSASPNHPATFANPNARDFEMRDRDALLLTSSSSVLRPASLTLSAWTKATTTDTGGALIVSMNDDYALLLRQGGDSRFAIRNSGVGGGSNWDSCIHTATTALNGNWHHLAATFTSNRMDIWFDGVKVTCSAPRNMNYTGNDLAIGRDPLATGGDFNGTIDDVRIYNRVLSDAEILGLYAGQ